MESGRRRSVIREHEFEEQLRELLVVDEEADEFIAAAEFVLSEDPTLGSRAAIGPPEIWMFPLPPMRKKAAALFYTFDDESVYFLHVVTYSDDEGR